MRDLFDDARGEFLVPGDYSADLAKRRLGSGAGSGSWKLERQQSFREPGEPSWVAFSDGRWDEALRLIEVERAGLEEYFSADVGVTYHRVRVVEEPITAYLHWEFYFLRVAVESGEKIRVVDSNSVRGFETNGVLPELLTIGDDTVYRICYDDVGVLKGAIRFVDAEITRRCVEFIQDLYATGDDLGSYFERKVARLAPPGAA